MEREHTLPTGLRTITPRMIAAFAARPAEWEPAARGKALSALKRAAPALAIPRRVVELVDYLVGRSQPADWSDGGRPMAWPSNATLRDALGLQRSQVQTLIRLGQEWGLFEMDDGPTGKRCGTVEGGRVIEAWGFDLTPLAARRAEFEQVAAAHEERRREGRRLRGQITALRKKVQALADTGTEQGIPGANWPALAAQARAVAALRGDNEDPAQLAPLVEQLATLHEQAKSALLAASPGPVDSVETGPSSPANPAPITPTNHLSIAKANTAEAGPNRPKAHRHEGSRDRPDTGGQDEQAARPESGRPASAPTSALRGFVVTPDWLVQVAPAFRAWVGSARPSWGELVEAAIYVCAELEISKHAWGQACVVLGRMEAVAALAVIATRHAAGKVGSPGGLLRKMVELHTKGELRLDKSLFGLEARLRRESARAAPGRAVRS